MPGANSEDATVGSVIFYAVCASPGAAEGMISGSFYHMAGFGMLQRVYSACAGNGRNSGGNPDLFFILLLPALDLLVELDRRLFPWPGGPRNGPKSFLAKGTSPKIVIDEIAGYLITMALLPRTLTTVIGGFLFFRIFDIMKTPPAGSVERRLSGGLAVVLDDAVAGIYANLLLHAIIHWRPHLLFIVDRWYFGTRLREIATVDRTDEPRIGTEVHSLGGFPHERVRLTRFP